MATDNSTLEPAETGLPVSWEIAEKALKTHEANTNPLIRHDTLNTLEKIQDAVSLIWSIDLSNGLSDPAICGVHAVLAAMRDALQFEMEHRAALEALEKNAEESEAQAETQEAAERRERDYQDSLKPENLLSVAKLLGEMSGNFASKVDEALKQQEVQA